VKAHVLGAGARRQGRQERYLPYVVCGMTFSVNPTPPRLDGLSPVDFSCPPKTGLLTFAGKVRHSLSLFPASHIRL
jgi:hypothetical protein